MLSGESPDKEKARRSNCEKLALSPKLWLYTNFDCNLRCSYCVTESTPTAPRRALGLANAQRLIDEAISLGFTDVFFTGGEPFILDEIYDMLAYSVARVSTTVLTNAMLIRGRQLDRLHAIAHPNLRVQVSLDGGRPEHNDGYRGQWTWAKTVEVIKQLQERDIHVCISTTETPTNSAHLDELHAFRRSLGIADKDHFVRPLAKRGFSQEGVEVGPDTLVPEVTVTAEGVYWHPLISPSAIDMRVTEQIFPLANAIKCIQQQLETQGDGSGEERTEFT